MKLLRYFLVLAVVCTVAAFGVAGTFKMTRGRIEERAKAERLSAQQKVVSAPEFTVINPDAKPAEQVVKATDDKGEILGYAAPGSARGYGGQVEVMVGMDAEARKIIGVSIVSQKETPGLGTRVAEIKSNVTWFSVVSGEKNAATETVPDFLKQFYEKTPEEAKLGSGVQAITGATISSRAVVNAVQDAVGRIRKAVLGEQWDPAGAGDKTGSTDPSATEATTQATTGATGQ